MASVNVTALPTVPDGHVRLVLFERQPDPFYLEIPLRIIREVCCRPPKYLRYLGWCILGGEGLLEDQQGNQVDLTGELVDQGIYHYRMPVQGYVLHIFVIPKLTNPQMSSPTQLTLRSLSYAAR